MIPKHFLARTTLAFAVLTATVASMNAAFAHAHLISSQPADKEMAMPTPTELKLTFSEGLEIKLSKVTITGLDKKEVKTDAPHLDPSNDKVLIVPLPAGLPDGTYKVDWQAVAKDTHKTTGTFSFDAMQ